jgi:adenylosuccinate synthase
LRTFTAKIGNLIIDNSLIKNEFSLKSILFEGAQGALLDLDHGSYPYVTSSNTVSSNIVIGSGLQLDYKTIGIFKAYATRVGNGPFPTELFDSIGDYIAKTGVEIGTVTKRKRRCGWLKYSCQINRVSELCITKVDVLNDLKEIKVCKSYQLKKYEDINFSDSNYLNTIQLLEDDYDIFPSWGDISEFKSYNELPDNLKNYITFIENYLEVPVTIVSLGPERNQTLLK